MIDTAAAPISRPPPSQPRIPVAMRKAASGVALIIRPARACPPSFVFLKKDAGPAILTAKSGMATAYSSSPSSSQLPVRRPWASQPRVTASMAQAKLSSVRRATRGRESVLDDSID